jgi:hypothetical protein
MMWKQIRINNVDAMKYAFRMIPINRPGLRANNTVTGSLSPHGADARWSS